MHTHQINTPPGYQLEYEFARQLLKLGHLLVVRSAVLDIVVLPPIQTRDWRRETLDAHIADVRALYEEVLAD